MIYVVNLNITMGVVFVLSLSILIELRLPKRNPEGEKRKELYRKTRENNICLMTNFVKKRSPELMVDLQ